jgi:flagellar protein FlaG
MSDIDRIDPQEAVEGVRRVEDRTPRSQHTEEEDRNKLSQLNQAMEELKAAASNLTVDLSFRLDPDLGVIVVTVKDGESGRVLRQIPPEEALRLAKLLRAGRQQLLDRLL